MEAKTPDPAVIEAIIFSSENGADINDLLRTCEIAGDEETDARRSVEFILQQLIDKFSDDHSGFELVCIAGRYQFFTKKKYYEIVQKTQAQTAQKNLSQAAMETLAIIAYRQPCVKSEIESIRGVNCDYSVDKLLEKNLIVITGQSDAPGKPLIYATSRLFEDYLGIDSLEKLPDVKELISSHNLTG